MDLRVTGFDDVQLEDGSFKTYYIILIRTLGGGSGGAREVRKRYSDFEALRAALQGRWSEVDNFRFPNKSKFRTHHQFTKERRQRGFEEWLRLVAAAEPHAPELDEFLRPNNGAAAAPGGRSPATSAGQRSPLSEAPAIRSPAAVADSKGAAASKGTPTRRSPPPMPPMARAGTGGGGALAGGATEGVPREGESFTPRFPPLADSGAQWGLPSEGGPEDGPAPTIASRIDALMRHAFSPILLAAIVLLASVAVTVVAVWKISGKAGILTMCVAVPVGLMIQAREGLAVHARELLQGALAAWGGGGSPRASRSVRRRKTTFDATSPPRPRDAAMARR